MTGKTEGVNAVNANEELIERIAEILLDYYGDAGTAYDVDTATESQERMAAKSIIALIGHKTDMEALWGGWV